ncbi:MAG TPA: COX15/CtaA family protein [Bryobacteraceae bacterium]|nr:COX15/CtaA family protein [Bryobacteraceae bacterium]
MRNLWLHLYAWLVAAGFVYLEVTGAIVAGQEGTPVGPHRLVASAVAVLVTGLAIWLTVAEKRAWLRRLGWMIVAGVVAEAGLGEMSGTASPLIGMLHAFLAPLLLALVVAIAVGTSKSWQHPPICLPDKGWPSLRGVARYTLILVVIQVALGALFRYDFIGVMTHIIGALVVAVYILTLVVLVTMMPEHPTLRPAAITLGVVIFVQIFLGLTVISMGSAKTNKTAALVFAVSHVVLGAITLATTLVVALETWRCVTSGLDLVVADQASEGNNPQP